MFGVGLIGNRAHQMLFAPIFEKRTDCRIVAAAEHDPVKGQPLTDCFGVACATDYDAVLENPEVDFVSIGTDFYLKHALIRKAIACGKHVLVDKPIGRTVREAREIAQAAATGRVKIVLTYPLRFQPSLAKLATAVRSGEYEDVASYVQHWIRQYPQGDLMEYVSYPTAPRVNGGGELMNLGSHAVDYTYSVFGMPRRLYCRMANLYWDEYKQFGTEDFASLLWDYGSFSAEVIVGRNKVEKELPAVNTVDLLCKGRWVRIDGDVYTVNNERVELPRSPLAPREACVQHLIDCIGEDREPITGVTNGIAVAQIVTAAYQSAQSGSFVSLPLKDEAHPLISAADEVIDGLLD